MVLVVADLLDSIAEPEAALSFLVLHSVCSASKAEGRFLGHQGSALSSLQPGRHLEEMRISRYGDVISRTNNVGTSCIGTKLSDTFANANLQQHSEARGRNGFLVTVNVYAGLKVFC